MKDVTFSGDDEPGAPRLLLYVSICASSLAFVLTGLPDILYLLRGGQEADMPAGPPWTDWQCDFMVLEDGSRVPCGRAGR